MIPLEPNVSEQSTQAATLVVQSHPAEASYNAALLERVVQGLVAGGAEASVHRLAQGETPSPKEVLASRRLVLVYPTWAAGLPAQLLEWVHGVLDDPQLLANIVRIDVVTTHGSSRFVNWAQGPWGKRYIRDLIKAHCAPSARLHWHPLYKVDRLEPAELSDHLTQIETKLAAR